MYYLSVRPVLAISTVTSIPASSFYRSLTSNNERRCFGDSYSRTATDSSFAIRPPRGQSHALRHIENNCCTVCNAYTTATDR